MPKEKIKKLTGKDKSEYEQAARHIVEGADEKAFEYLVSQDDFLFDFIKNNAAKRLSEAINIKNFKNLLPFLKYYSPSYAEAIAGALAKYADEDITDTMLELFSSGTDEQKAYCAEFFAKIQDTLALEILRDNAFSEFSPLAYNCARTLGILKDEKAFDTAVEKISADDEFKVLAAVRFLSAYGDKRALQYLFKAVKSSPLAENISAEIPYIEGFFELFETDFDDALLVLNNIISALGEVIALSVVFDYALWEVFSALLEMPMTSKSAIVLLNAKQRFEDLTENDEYLFDEDKNTKTEVFEIKKLLKNVDVKTAQTLVEGELSEKSPFVLSAVEITRNTQKLRNLLEGSNQTAILKSLERLKTLDELSKSDIETALKHVSDKNIEMVVRAL